MKVALCSWLAVNRRAQSEPMSDSTRSWRCWTVSAKGPFGVAGIAVYGNAR